MGVNRPPISWKMTMKANMTKMLCRRVDERLAMLTPNPDMTRVNRMAAR